MENAVDEFDDIFLGSLKPEVDALKPLMERITANTGAYRGDAAGDSVRRILAALLTRGWTPPSGSLGPDR